MSRCAASLRRAELTYGRHCPSGIARSGWGLPDPLTTGPLARSRTWLGEKVRHFCHMEYHSAAVSDKFRLNPVFDPLQFSKLPI